MSFGLLNPNQSTEAQRIGDGDKDWETWHNIGVCYTYVDKTKKGDVQISFSQPQHLHSSLFLFSIIFRPLFSLSFSLDLSFLALLFNRLFMLSLVSYSRPSISLSLSFPFAKKVSKKTKESA